MKNIETVNILFCGIGGQGVLTASELCAWAAVYEGYHVKKSEVHGMAQRGGSVESHLRFGKAVYSPLIPCGQAHYLVSFYKDEGERLRGFLKSGTGRDLSRYLEQAQKTLEDRRYLNTFLVGILSRYLKIKEKSWIRGLEAVFSAKNLQENKRIFLLGRGKRS